MEKSTNESAFILVGKLRLYAMKNKDTVSLEMIDDLGIRLSEMKECVDKLEVELQELKNL